MRDNARPRQYTGVRPVGRPQRARVAGSAARPRVVRAGGDPWARGGPPCSLRSQGSRLRRSKDKSDNVEEVAFRRFGTGAAPVHGTGGKALWWRKSTCSSAGRKVFGGARRMRVLGRPALFSDRGLSHQAPTELARVARVQLPACGRALRGGGPRRGAKEAGLLVLRVPSSTTRQGAPPSSRAEKIPALRWCRSRGKP